MYMMAILFAFGLGGLFAILLRTMLWAPVTLTASNAASAKQSYDLYNHFFTLHGAVMVFMFIIPAIPAILGNFILPMMLGAKDVAFPRLNLLSFHLYALGGLFFVYVLLSGVLNAGLGIRMPGGFGPGHRVDVLHALLDGPLVRGGGAGDAGGVHHGIQLDPDRA